MNREIKNQSSFQTANKSVYYAPVASTRGDIVEIYRFAFEEQCALLKSYPQRAEPAAKERDTLRVCEVYPRTLS